MHYTLNSDKKCCHCIKLGTFFRLLPVFYFSFYFIDLYIYEEASILLSILVISGIIIHGKIFSYCYFAISILGAIGLFVLLIFGIKEITLYRDKW
jgi:hypothetical protein